jgi:GNAT superfamily N-acetyltransferase
LNEGPLASGWFYSRPSAGARRDVGPLDWEELWQLARLELLAPDDLVWQEQLAGWVPAAQVQGLLPRVARRAGRKRLTAAASKCKAFVTGAWQAFRRRPLLAWAVPAVVVVCVGLSLVLFFALQGTRGGPDTWLVMMYMAADDEVLEEDAVFDMNEAELVGSTERVTVVAQLDRYAGGYSGDGDWTSTRRYLLAQDANLYNIGSELIADLGELDMGQPQTLYDFATWAIEAYPSEHYALILSDHGAGWTGGWTDNSPMNADGLSMQEMDEVLGDIVADTGIGALELVGLDACLMGQLEVMSSLVPHALYAVASEETEDSVGWAFGAFLGALAADPSMSGRGLGQAIVDSYIENDERVNEEEAASGAVNSEAMMQGLMKTSTLSAIDLSAIQELDAAVNELVVSLTEVDQSVVAQCRTYAQSYSSLFNDDDPPSFIDLGSFVDLLIAEVEDPSVAAACQEVRDALSQAVVAEKHGDERPGSTGLTIYFPNSEEYSYTFSEAAMRRESSHYPSSIGRFAAATLWDDYLTFHYTGEPVDASAADLSAVTPALAGQTDFATAVEESAPAADAEVVAPGAGGVTLASLEVSATEIGPDEQVTISTQVSGSNVAYVYYYVSYRSESSDSFLSAAAGYIKPGNVKESGGVYYPDWGSGEVIPIAYDWDPVLYCMSSGEQEDDEFAYFQPTVYGAETAGDIYSVWGTYRFVDTGTDMDAVIDFSGEGEMLHVWGYGAGEGGLSAGAWHELTPRPGDIFTITDEYLETDQNPEGEFVDYPGGQMTLGDTPFTMVPYYALPGYYRIGIGAEDLDGNTTWQFVDVTVTE